jgi:hypothetical protein
MNYLLALTLSGALSVGMAAQQSLAPPTEVLATVRVPAGVLADGKPLPAGAYELRLTQERPAPLAGQSPDAQRIVEFVADGRVVARETAEVLRDSDVPAVGTSSQPVQSGARVEMLKGGEFLRVSVKRAGERYLIHLRVVR